MLYERNLEKEEVNGFCDSEDTAYINFQGLVNVGDVIRCTDSFIETVTKVNFDGSFYTEIEIENLYMDEVTDLYSFDDETIYDDNFTTQPKER